MGSDYDSDGKLKAGIDVNKETAKVAEIKSKNVNDSDSRASQSSRRDVVAILKRIERLLEKIEENTARLGWTIRKKSKKF